MICSKNQVFRQKCFKKYGFRQKKGIERRESRQMIVEKKCEYREKIERKKILC